MAAEQVLIIFILPNPLLDGSWVLGVTLFCGVPNGVATLAPGLGGWVLRLHWCGGGSGLFANWLHSGGCLQGNNTISDCIDVFHQGADGNIDES